MERSARDLRIAEVAGGDRGTPELDAPFHALSDGLSGPVHDAHLVPGQRSTAAHETERRGIIRPGRLRQSALLKWLASDGVDSRLDAEGRGRQGDRSLREAVNRTHGLGPKADRGET